VNYYVDNQWIYPGNVDSSTTIGPAHPRYRPVWDMLREVHERYRRPLFLAETGIENEARPLWLRYICQEARAALREGVPLEGICLYPILNHPGWEDDRHCHNGLWDYADESGERQICAPYAEELRLQQALFEQMRRGEPLPPAEYAAIAPIWESWRALGYVPEASGSAETGASGE